MGNECIGTIIDRMEDFMARLTGSEEAVIIGEDYDWMAGQIREVLGLWGMLPKEHIWYTEIWTDDDLITALEEEGVEATAENLEKVKELAIPLFDDKTMRNEQIADVVSQLFQN